LFAVFFEMAPYSSEESCKQNSPSKASLRGELLEAQRHIRRLEGKVAKTGHATSWTV